MRPIAFEARREAGTFRCVGEAGADTGAGTFRFEPSTEWAAAVQLLGVSCSLRDQVNAAMADVTVAYLRSVVDRGLQSNSMMGLIGLKMSDRAISEAREFDAHLPNIDASSFLSQIASSEWSPDASFFRSEFPQASIDDVIMLGISGVTPGFVTALKGAKIDCITPGNLLALRSVGVSEAFVARIIENGQLGLTVDELVAVKQQGEPTSGGH
jgi:hypothetical protein